MIGCAWQHAGNPRTPATQHGNRGAAPAPCPGQPGKWRRCHSGRPRRVIFWLRLTGELVPGWYRPGERAPCSQVAAARVALPRTPAGRSTVPLAFAATPPARPSAAGKACWSSGPPGQPSRAPARPLTPARAVAQGLFLPGRRRGPATTPAGPRHPPMTGREARGHQASARVPGPRVPPATPGQAGGQSASVPGDRPSWQSPTWAPMLLPTGPLPLSAACGRYPTGWRPGHAGQARLIPIVAGVIVGAGAAGLVGLPVSRVRRSLEGAARAVPSSAEPCTRSHGNGAGCPAAPTAAARDRAPYRTPPAPARRVRWSIAAVLAGGTSWDRGEPARLPARPIADRGSPRSPGAGDAGAAGSHGYLARGRARGQSRPQAPPRDRTGTLRR